MSFKRIHFALFLSIVTLFVILVWALSQTLVLTIMEYSLFLVAFLCSLLLHWAVYKHVNKKIRQLINYDNEQIESVNGLEDHLTNHHLEHLNLRKLCENLEVKNDYNDWLLNLMPNYLLVLNNEFEVIQCNQKFSSLINEKRETIEGKKLEFLGLKELKDKLLGKNVWLSEDDITHCTFEWLHIDDKDRTRYVSWYCNHDKDRKYYGEHYILLGADISVVKESQNEMLKMKERAEAASQAKSTFLATMSHEIRTPLNGVIGMIDLLNYELIDDRSKEMISTVSVSAGHLLSIINDILDFSKIESGNLKLEMEPFDLIDIISEVGAAFRIMAHDKKISLFITLDQQVPNQLLGDSVRFKQILTNLISNALKFTVSKIAWQGFIHLKIEQFDSSDNKVGLVFRVEDNGVGIEDDKLHSIFQPFEQEESSTTRKFGGTGLGLSITSRLSQAMEGDIWVVSSKGEGTEFTCYLPFELQNSDTPSYFDDCLLGQKCVVFTRNQFVFKELESAICGMAGSLEWFETMVSVDGYDHIFVLDEQLDYFESLLINYPQKVILLCTSADTVYKSDYYSLPRCHILPLDFQQVKVLVVQEDKKVSDVKKTSLLNHNAKILLAEDYEINRKVIVAQLAKLGIKADTAEDGQVAWTMLKNKEYDLLLTDCHMPNMDGYELAKKIRQSANPQFEKLDIIAITANAMKGEREICLAAGMNDFITKPIKLDQLKEILSCYLASQVDEPEKITAIKPETHYFNPQKLIEIIGEDEALKLELLQDYLDISAQTMADINQAIKDNNFTALAGFSHKLKSPSKGIGAQTIFTLCENMENYALTEKSELIEPLLIEINNNMAMLQQEVELYIKAHA